jgi:NRPS condensation-like uncharacterized protein
LKPEIGSADERETPMGAGPPGATAAQPQDIYNEHARAACDQQVAFLVRVPGGIDRAALATAVERLVAAQPVLGSRFVVDGRIARFEPLADAAGRALAVHEAKDAWSRGLELVASPLDPHAGPLLGVDLVCGADGDVVALRVDHTAADGQGAKQGLYLLARACDSELSGLPVDRSWARLRRRFSLLQRLSALRGRQAPRPTWGVPRSGVSTGGRRYAVATFEPDLFAAFRARGRESGATVNDLVLTALYRALFEGLDARTDRPMAVNVSFDLRRYLDARDPMPPISNLSSVETALVCRRANEDFVATLVRVCVETARLKQGTPGLGSAVLLEYACRLQGASAFRKTVAEPMARGREHGVSFPFLSNFGVLDREKLVFAGAEADRAVVFGPAGHPPFVMLGASSFAGALALTMGWVEGEADAALIEGVVRHVARELEAFAGEPTR